MTNRRNRALGQVLVTGAAGFLGGELVRRLMEMRAHVIATDCMGAGGGDGSPRHLDVTDANQVTETVGAGAIDTIFHCGAVSGPMVMTDRPAEIWRINAGGTANILEAARLRGVGRVLLCSSVDVYGSRNPAMLDEAVPPAPDTVYGASKVAAEQALIGYSRQYELDTGALRFAWIYGPGRRTPSMIPRLLEDGLAGRETVLDAAPRDLTHYMHVDDAVAALLAAARTERLPRLVYNATAGRGLPIQELIGQISALLPQARIRLSDGEVPRDPGPLGFDNGNAQRDFGYAPAVSLRDGLRRYLAALRTSSSGG
jgi:nucleoside-diphosphate-sugar epimerase